MAYHFYDKNPLVPNIEIEDITKTKYKEMMKSLTEVDLSNVIEVDDNTNLSGELACAGGSCEIR